MDFNNKPNILHNCNGKQIWESRSVAVNVLIMAFDNTRMKVLCAKRGPNAADFQGKMNLIAGYLDWDESGTEAAVRETYEETGINIYDIMNNYITIENDLYQPWHVATEPSLNRQNVSLRYALVFQQEGELPKLTTQFNEVEGEVEDPQWLDLSDIDNYEWAFNHDKVIKDYIKRIENKMFNYE